MMHALHLSRALPRGVFREAAQVGHLLSLDSMAMSWVLAELLGEMFAHLGANHWRSMLRRESNCVQFLFKK